MFMRILFTILISGSCLTLISDSQAGIYSTIDSEEEADRRSPNFQVFQKTLLAWQSIPAPEGANPPIKRRYVVLEKLGAKSGAALKKPEDILNYTAVLIRRGRADEACEILANANREDPDHFVILSQCATAHFLGSPEFKAKTRDYSRTLFDQWPKRWSDLQDEQKTFLNSIGWEETAFDRNRRYEKHFERLMRSRMSEDKRLQKKEVLKDAIDPIFGDEKNPVRFLNEKGEFEVGRIPSDELKQLPDDAPELVEQLLVWMPNDERLLWLLGEVLNAEAMKVKNAKEKHSAIRNAGLVFKRLHELSFNRSGMYGHKEFERRFDVLNEHIKNLPPEFEDPRNAEVEKFIKKVNEEEETPLLNNPIFWRALIVGLITGFVIGMFALWQLQEVRRRNRERANVRG